MTLAIGTPLSFKEEKQKVKFQYGTFDLHEFFINVAKYECTHLHLYNLKKYFCSENALGSKHQKCSIFSSCCEGWGDNVWTG